MANISSRNGNEPKVRRSQSAIAPNIAVMWLAKTMPNSYAMSHGTR